ncbi:XK-related protein 4 isoform X1 [Cyprinodon tularosa]|uniref:XK-related protein 4 isoform X1 n=1 Tax=Cyprinodon tularosa TaxID=77115 RepID=UPI0018E25020|nr:XK-related protein 4 isoform X1 [Cyprinodon tularosa]
MMAAKSDGVLKMKRSDVAFTPLQNSEHTGSVQGLHLGEQSGSACALDRGGSTSSCLLDRTQQNSLIWDCLWVIAAVTVYVADVGTDVWLSVDYYLRQQYWWFGLTLFFVVLGSFSVQLFSFRWFVTDFSTEDSSEPSGGCAQADGSKLLLSGSASQGEVPIQTQRQSSTASRNTATNSTGSSVPGRTRRTRSGSYSVCVWLSQSVLHILQLGHVWRCFRTMYLGIRSHQSSKTERWRYHWRMVYEFADVSMLHLLATFLESAPQLVLQLCIIIQTHSLQAVQGMTAAASLVSLAWALASYQKALRESREDKKPLSYLAVIIQLCWHFFTIAARVITFALFASVFQLYFGIFIVLHWCIMTFWIVHCETDFCISKWEEIVFDMVVGIIYIFSWFNVKEGCTRYRLSIYYLVVLVENTTLSALWFLYRSHKTTDAFAVPALCVIFSSFLTGLVFMLMYYAFFHPNGARFGRSASGQGLDLDSTAQFSTLPCDGATNSLRSNRGATSTLERETGKYSERDSCIPVFQVRHPVPSTPSSRAPRLDETVIKLDLCRNQYPAWERHVLDRSIRKAILGLDCSLTPPRLMYKDDATVHERLEYETTL